jgi:hypothetical protein
MSDGSKKGREQSEQAEQISSEFCLKLTNYISEKFSG